MSASSSVILEELSDEDLELLVSIAQVRDIPAGMTVIQQGDKEAPIFIILSGRFQVSVGSMQQPLADLYAGELIGEMSFVDKRASSALVKAIEPGKVLFIGRSDLENMVGSHPGFAARLFRGFARLVVRRLRKTIEHLTTQVTPAPDVSVQVDKRLLERLSRSRHHSAGV